MTAAIDLITGALQEIGAYGSGDGAIASTDLDICLRRLNAMMDSWSNENLFCYANLEQSIALVPGQSQYTIGVGGQINGPRPLKIDQAYITDASGNIFNLTIMDQREWNMIGQRNVSNDISNTLFYDPQFPLGIINLFGIPSATPYTLTVDSYLQLQGFPALNTPLTLPPGYELAITLNLALQVAALFGMQPSPLTLANAGVAKGNVKRKNMKEVIAQYDKEIVSKAGGSYNVYSDGYRP